jgi:hypothetical protein
MSNQVSYDDGVKGFPSFYSYYADWMIGMNNYFFTFNQGNIYRHNTNPIRNRYYGVDYPSKVQSVFNDQPLENKLFKTINLEGDDSWDTLIVSDQQDSGYIWGGQNTVANWYEKKEGAYFAFIRNDGSVPAQLDQYALRSLNGIANSLNILVDFPVPGQSQVNFEIGSIISTGSPTNNDGDMVYFGAPTPSLLGQVLSVNVNKPAGINNIIVDNTIAGAVTPPAGTHYILFIKNSVAESHGILGHYGVFTLENRNTEKVELFAVETEAMKSFP